MDFEPVISKEKFREEADNLEEDSVFTESDLLHELRDPYPLREFVLAVVEMQYTHPDDWHNKITLSDTTESIVEDYLRDLIPVDELSKETYLKEMDDLKNEIYDPAEKLYDATKEEAEETQSIGELQDLLEEKYDELDLPEEC